MSKSEKGSKPREREMSFCLLLSSPSLLLCPFFFLFFSLALDVFFSLALDEKEKEEGAV
jgi:hypothetical protein